MSYINHLGRHNIQAKKKSEYKSKYVYLEYLHEEVLFKYNWHGLNNRVRLSISALQTSEQLCNDFVWSRSTISEFGGCAFSPLLWMQS